MLYPVLSWIYDTKAFDAVFGAVKNRGVGPSTVNRLLRGTGLVNLYCQPAGNVTADARSGFVAVEKPFFGWVHYYFDLHEPRERPDCASGRPRRVRGGDGQRRAPARRT